MVLSINNIPIWLIDRNVPLTTAVSKRTRVGDDCIKARHVLGNLYLMSDFQIKCMMDTSCLLYKNFILGSTRV